MPRFPMVTAVALMLVVCACSRAEPVVLASTARPILPAEARLQCDEPAPKPDRDLLAREVLPLWSRDRVALRICERRRAAAVMAVDAMSITAER